MVSCSTCYGLCLIAAKPMCRAKQEKVSVEKISVFREKPAVVNPPVGVNLPGLMKCASCGKNAGFRSPFPGIMDWVCSDPCGAQLPAQLRNRKVLKGYPTSGLGFLSSLAMTETDCEKSPTSSTVTVTSSMSKEAMGAKL